MKKERKRKPLYKRWWVYPIALILLIIAIGEPNPEKVAMKEEKAAKAEQQKQEVERMIAEAQAKKAAPKQPKTPVTLKERVKAVLDDELVSDQKASFEIFEGHQNIAGANRISIIIKRKDFISAKSERKDILRQTAHLTEKLFENNDIADVTIDWRLPITLPTGAKKMTTAIFVDIERATADSIAWSDFDPLKIPDIADQYVQSPGFE